MCFGCLEQGPSGAPLTASSASTPSEPRLATSSADASGDIDDSDAESGPSGGPAAPLDWLEELCCEEPLRRHDAAVAMVTTHQESFLRELQVEMQRPEPRRLAARPG